MTKLGKIAKVALNLSAICLSACTSLKAPSDITVLKGPNMPTGVYNMGYATDGKTIYCIGGANLWKTTKHATDEIYLFSPVIGKWKKGNFRDKIAEKQATSSVYLDDLNGIFSTGFAYLPKPNFYTFPIEIVDLQDYSIRYRSDNPHMALQSGVVYWNKKVYVFGGRTFDNEGSRFYSDHMLSFDPYTDQWSTLSQMPAPRVTYGTVLGDYLYTFGGFDEEKIYDDIWRYDFVEDAWQVMGYLPYSASNFGVSQKYPYIFLSNIGHEQNIIGRFDVRSGSLMEIKIPITTTSAGSVIVGDYLYIFGGMTDGGKTATNKTFKIPLTELMVEE